MPDAAGEARGRLVVVTGIDGCGKSTQAERLAAWLRGQGLAVSTGGWRFESVEGQFIGDLVKRVSKADLALPPETAALLFAANLSYRAERHLRPALAAGHVFVEDDYAYKMTARAFAWGLSRPWVESLFRGLPAPDLVFLLDVPPEDALRRVGDRVTLAEAGFDAADRPRGFLRHQAAVRAELLALAARRGFEVVPAARLPEERVAERLRERVEALLAAAR